MSVTAHYTECYVLNRHFSSVINFRWLIVGSAFPDAFVFDRLFMYTIDMRMHRDYFFGWFHSLPVPLVLAALVYHYFGRRPALGFLAGSWLHVLTDVFDELGVMLFWPFTAKRFSAGIWPWSDTTVWHDLYVYFTTPASGLFELFFFVWAVAIIRRGEGPTFIAKALRPWREAGWSEIGPEPKRGGEGCRSGPGGASLSR